MVKPCNKTVFCKALVCFVIGKSKWNYSFTEVISLVEEKLQALEYNLLLIWSCATRNQERAGCMEWERMTKKSTIFSTEEMKPGFLLQALQYVWTVQALLIIYYTIILIIFMLIAFRKLIQIRIMTLYCSNTKINIVHNLLQYYNNNYVTHSKLLCFSVLGKSKDWNVLQQGSA